MIDFANSEFPFFEGTINCNSVSNSVYPIGVSAIRRFSTLVIKASTLSTWEVSISASIHVQINGYLSQSTIDANKATLPSSRLSLSLVSARSNFTVPIYNLSPNQLNNLIFDYETISSRLNSRLWIFLGRFYSEIRCFKMSGFGLLHFCLPIPQLWQIAVGVLLLGVETLG